MAELAAILAGTAFDIKKTIEDLVEDGNTDVITAGAAAVPLPCDGSTYIYRTNGNLYDETTGEIDCSNFGLGTDLLLKWTGIATPTNANAVVTVQVVIPDGVSPGVDIVAFEKAYTFATAAALPFSNSTIFYISELVKSNNLRLQIKCTTFNVTVGNRAVLTVH